MKAGEIRDLNFEEMHQKVSDLKGEFFNLRFQHEIGQLEDPQRMKQTKRDIARLKTIIQEVALNPKKDNE
jgi:large subunit ribosomal protein L29